MRNAEISSAVVNDRTTSQQDCITELFTWLCEIESCLKRMQPVNGLANKEASVERIQHLRTMRWLQSLDLENDE